MRTFISRALANFGIEAKRIPKNQYGWLRDLNINTVLDIGANTGQFATLIHDILPEADITPSSHWETVLRSSKGTCITWDAFAHSDTLWEKGMTNLKFIGVSSPLALPFSR